MYFNLSGRSPGWVLSATNVRPHHIHSKPAHRQRGQRFVFHVDSSSLGRYCNVLWGCRRRTLVGVQGRVHGRYKPVRGKRCASIEEAGKSKQLVDLYHHGVVLVHNCRREHGWMSERGDIRPNKKRSLLRLTRRIVFWSADRTLFPTSRPILFGAAPCVASCVVDRDRKREVER